VNNWMRRNLVPAAALVLALVAVACSGGGTDPVLSAPYRSPSGTATNVLDPNKTITVYASPDCDCCHDYIPYLVDNGYLVNEVSVQDINAPKVEYGVPKAAWSCHTSAIGKYFIEGHVPVEAIAKLLAEKPNIDGIALPGMPSGAPGMNGEKTAPLEIVAIKDGVITPFMTI